MIADLGVVGWGRRHRGQRDAGSTGVFLDARRCRHELDGALKPGVTATDLVLHITHLLQSRWSANSSSFTGPACLTCLTAPRSQHVARVRGGVAFPGRRTDVPLPAPDRAPGDAGEALETYFRTQQCFGAPMPGEVDYSSVIDLDLASVEPSLAGPKATGPHPAVATGGGLYGSERSPAAATMQNPPRARRGTAASSSRQSHPAPAHPIPASW